MTEDYEVGLRIGALGLKTMFVRIPATPGERGVVASRGHFPATLGAAVRQKARWLGGIALVRMGPAGLERRPRRALDADARPARAARRLAAPRSLFRRLAVVAAVACRSARRAGPGADGFDALTLLLTINVWLLAWRVLMRAGFTASAYGLGEGPAVDPAPGGRQRHRHARRGARAFRSISAAARSAGTRPGTSSRRSCRNEAVAPLPRAGGDRLGGRPRGDARRAARRRDVPDRPQRGQAAPPPIVPTAISADRAGRSPYDRASAAARGRLRLPHAARPRPVRPVVVPVYYPALSSPALDLPPPPARRTSCPSRRRNSIRRSRRSTNGRCRALRPRRCRAPLERRLARPKHPQRALKHGSTGCS